MHPYKNKVSLKLIFWKFLQNISELFFFIFHRVRQMTFLLSKRALLEVNETNNFNFLTTQIKKTYLIGIKLIPVFVVFNTTNHDTINGMSALILRL